MEDQIRDFTAFLKGMQAGLISTRSTLGPSCHSVDDEQWGLGNGAVTTIIPTLVTGVRNP
jgi:hypothetical protein